MSSQYLGKMVPISHPISAVWRGNVPGAIDLLDENHLSVSRIWGVEITCFDPSGSGLAVQINGVPADDVYSTATGILVDYDHPLHLIMDTPINELQATSIDASETMVQVLGM